MVHSRDGDKAGEHPGAGNSLSPSVTNPNDGLCQHKGKAREGASFPLGQGFLAISPALFL